MSPRILALLALGAVPLLVLTAYPSMYTFVVFVVPIDNAILVEDYAHVDLIPIDQETHSFPIESIAHHAEDDTITVAFAGGTDPVTGMAKDIEHVETYAVNESFAFDCTESNDGTHLDLYGYLGTVTENQTEYVRLWHGAATTQNDMPCVFPEVIHHSKGFVDLP